jgi:hypothetical protein
VKDPLPRGAQNPCAQPDGLDSPAGAFRLRLSQLSREDDIVASKVAEGFDQPSHGLRLRSVLLAKRACHLVKLASVYLFCQLMVPHFERIGRFDKLPSPTGTLRGSSRGKVCPPKIATGLARHARFYRSVTSALHLSVTQTKQPFTISKALRSAENR